MRRARGGVVAEGDRPPRRRARDVTEHGVTRERLLEVLTDVRGSQRVTIANPETAYEALAKYGRDLVE